MTELPTIEIDPGEMARLMKDKVKNLPAPAPSDSGFTAREYAKENGVGFSTARKHIRSLQDQGLLIKGRRWARRRGDGNWQALPVYRPKDKTK